jgi:hypothetical protein
MGVRVDTPKLDFHLNWLGEHAISLVNLSATIDNKPVWPVVGDDNSDLEVFADDILSFLTENWHSILLEQTCPIYNLPRPSLLRQAAKVAWAQDENLDAEAEDVQIEIFERAHNLASCFAGMMEIPPLWLMRRDKVMVVENEKKYWTPSLNQVQKALCSLGDAIAERFSGEEKFSILLTAWKNRSDKDPLTLLATAASLPPSYAKNLVSENILRAPLNFEDAANDEDELRIAARITGALSLQQVRSILSVAKSIPLGSSDALQRVKKTISTELLESPLSEYRRPHDIGMCAAISARRLLGYSSAQRIDLEKVISQLQITLKCADNLTESFKGLAIWGTHHGPGIVVTQEGGNGPWGSGFHRVTIAHELGHLLMDSDHAIGAVDVLRGRTSPHIEQRARAFAGELLLPAKTAANAWQRDGHPSDREKLAKLVQRLQRTYGVTKSVAAWKLEHGLKSLDVDLSDLLDDIVPGR